METFSVVVSIVGGCATLLGFVGIFVKYGKDKGTLETTLKTFETTLKSLVEKSSEIPNSNVMQELRKDIDRNAKDINALGTKVNQMQLENSKMITALSSDQGWIKSSLMDIKRELSRKKE